MDHNELMSMAVRGEDIQHVAGTAFLALCIITCSRNGPGPDVYRWFFMNSAARAAQSTQQSKSHAAKGQGLWKIKGYEPIGFCTMGYRGPLIGTLLVATNKGVAPMPIALVPTI